MTCIRFESRLWSQNWRFREIDRSDKNDENNKKPSRLRPESLATGFFPSTGVLNSTPWQLLIRKNHRRYRGHRARASRMEKDRLLQMMEAPRQRASLTILNSLSSKLTSFVFTSIVYPEASDTNFQVRVPFF